MGTYIYSRTIGYIYIWEYVYSRTTGHTYGNIYSRTIGHISNVKGPSCISATAEPVYSLYPFACTGHA